MRIWEKILCSWACAAYCQNCEPNSHALRAQTVVLRSDAMCAHSRIFKQMLILSCAPAAFYVIGNKKCRSKPINSFHAGGGLYLSTAFFMWHIQYSRKGSSMYNKHSVGNFGPFVSIADRAEALPEHAKRVSWPEPCLIGGGTKGPENCRECVYTWRGSFYCIGISQKKIQYLSVMSPCYLLFYAIEAGKSSVFLNFG